MLFIWNLNRKIKRKKKEKKKKKMIKNIVSLLAKCYNWWLTDNLAWNKEHKSKMMQLAVSHTNDVGIKKLHVIFKGK